MNYLRIFSEDIFIFYSAKIYYLSEALVVWIYGVLGHVLVVVNMLFAGMRGSSVAAIASIGKMSINALEKKGYASRSNWYFKRELKSF